VHPSSTARISKVRCLTLALLAGALLFGWWPAQAAPDGSCQPAPGRSPSSRSVVGYAYIAMPLNQGQTGVREPFALDTRITIARDGRARAGGAIHAPLAPYVPILVISKNIVTVSCLDLDGDGKRGLARLAGEFQDAVGEPVDVILTVLAQDVDAPGIYAVSLQIGEETLTGETRFEIDRDSPPHKGKVKGKGKRSR
jgi:hypothetical protein